MAQIQQQITLTVSVSDLNVGAAGGVVKLELSPTAKFPAYVEFLQINTVTMQYMRRGAAVWPVNPALLTGPGSGALAVVTADIDAATAAGVFNL